MSRSVDTLGSAVEAARAAIAAVRAEPGASTEALRAVLEAAGEEADDVLDAVAEVRAQSARLRRRAGEVEALYSTARELVRLRDVDEVLDRLVERAHALMGTDVTYLSEAEVQTGDMRVRHSVGTVTPEFRDLRVPAGMGLASMVADRREPAWVARYETMSDAPHHEGIDDAVRAEGLVSFLGVPLAVGDEVLGALFACNRFAYDYSPEEVLLLSAFADHAASVLHTARLLADREAATARAEDAYRELEEHLAATERAGALHEELTEAVISGGSVVDLVAVLSRHLDRPVWALDEDGRPLAGDQPLPRRQVLADAAARSLRSGHVEELDGLLVAAIPGADRVVGAIVSDDDGLLPPDMRRRTLERAAHVAGLLSFQREAVSRTRAERRGALLSALLDGAARPASGDPTLALPGPVTGCAVVDLGGAAPARATALAAEAAGDDGLVVLREGRLVLAWTSDAAAATERVRRVLTDRLDAEPTAVVSRVDDGPDAHGRAFRRAARDLAYLPALGLSGLTVASEALAPYHSLTSAEPQAAVRFVDDLVGGVLAWDERRGAQLFDTLRGYFDAGENVSEAASRLGLHKNTVRQRLDRIRILVDGDWADAEFRFRVQAAVRLAALRRELDAGA